MKSNIQFKLIDPAILYFGTPVALITTINSEGDPNIGPISSVWALGWTMFLGLECASKTFQNLSAQKECVVNLPNASLFNQVEKIANLTGAWPVPEYKKERYYYEADKFTAGNFSKQESVQVKPPRIAECSIHLECVFKNSTIVTDDPKEAGQVAAVEVRVLKVHADKDLLGKNDHIDPQKWNPLIYNFRHYYGLGEELGKTFKAES
jgi:flavin reductase (DIM6/NTAB) family NADH-FMN oxidoreductase RutF